MKVNELLVKFLVWRIKHIDNRNFVLLLSGVIGALAGLAAVLLKQSVHLIHQALTLSFKTEYANYLYLSYPLIGILLTVLFAHFVLKEKLGHGVTDILYTISKKSSIIQRGKMYSRMITSALTVGFGGSVGLEAPIVVTGSAIGSNIGRLMHLNYKKRTILLGCGAAGAISAIFNAPIGGVIFCVEVILAEISIASFIPLLIASVFGSIVSLLLLGDDVLFSVKVTDLFKASDTPYYLMLGIVCGLASLYFTRATYWVEGKIGGIKKTYKRILIGGLLLGLIIFVLPPIYGEGYESIKALLSNNGSGFLNRSLFFSSGGSPYILLFFALAVFIAKPIASALTISSGGSGGVFAPSLFSGGVIGFCFAIGIQMLLGEPISVSNFTLVGMCGVMSGVLHAPLTAIFLIAEITGGYELFVPLMLVSAISYVTISYFEKHSIYTKHLVERGDLIQHDKDRQVLSLIDMNKIIETDLLTIEPTRSLGDLVELIKVSKRNVFPVVNDKGELMGIVTLDDIREVMFDEASQNNLTIKELMHSPPAVVSSYDSMATVMKKFEETHAWNLPVIDNGKYTGFISKSRIFNAYRNRLIRQHAE
ncbi:chloride channel protein [Cytophagales bacterium LB-30]|uniref:Chloride channel protein n=1 Tax=Shiella aurantiaca TaxID=3058365 RepID=A0ABT8F8L1_9BACT|nr:chloride channel protein [Shiella aurantiaca]MDN4166785.1 chloride channel protein [Shiella aurantiaca]